MKVRRYFVDAETGEAYQPGSEYTARPERLAELQAAGYVGKTGGPGPQDTPVDAPAETKGVTDSAKPRDSAKRKPADNRPARKR